MTALALDTSVAVPLLLRRHDAHRAVRAAVRNVVVSMTGHSLAETYSVLTRLPGDARLEPVDAATLLSSGFGPVLVVDPETAAEVANLLGALNIAGGAVYDALVGLAARAHDATLLTRDSRAAGTYAALGVAFEFV